MKQTNSSKALPKPALGKKEAFDKMHEEIQATKETQKKGDKKDPTQNALDKLPPVFQQMVKEFMKASGLTPETLAAIRALPQLVANQAKRITEIENNLTTINNLVSQGMEYAEKMGVQLPQGTPQEQGKGNPKKNLKGGINPQGLSGALELFKQLKGMKGQEETPAQKLMNRLLEGTVNNTLAMQTQRLDLNLGNINALVKAGLLSKEELHSKQKTEV